MKIYWTKNLALAVSIVFAVALTHRANLAADLGDQAINISGNTSICKAAAGADNTTMFGFTVTGNLTPGAFNLFAGQCQFVIGTGSGTVTESSIPPGWALANVSVSGNRVTFINTMVPTVIMITLDIKPQSCPNSLNAKQKGTLSVAILGSATFDVTTIDVSTLKLQGVSPLRSVLEDVATPFNGSAHGCNDCTTAGPDGFTDLTLKFDAQAIAAALGSTMPGDCRALTLTGNLLDGTSIQGTDFVRFAR